MKKDWIVIIILSAIALVLGAKVILPAAGQKDAGPTVKIDKEKKILYYRNPMDPQVTSPVPAKDPMGMDYVPVYENETDGRGAGIYIAPQKQQLVGIQTEKVEKRDLTQVIRTVGRIAYDPDLYVAQEEYIQALKMSGAVKNSALASVAGQSAELLAAGQKKLQLLGMTKEEIEALAKKGAPQENLYLPGDQQPVWAYLVIHEQEIGLIKEGMPVQIEAIAFPGETFKGVVAAINPVLDVSTRSVQVRAEIANPDNKLKPEMYVNAKIEAALGEHIAVPESAVMDTGERSLVFIAKPDGYFESRDIKTGDKAGGYYQVLSGLSEGEEVVSSGNFFVDSESKLKGLYGQPDRKNN